MPHLPAKVKPGPAGRYTKKYTRFYLLAGTGMIPLMYLLSWLIIRWKLSPAGAFG